QLKSKGKEKLTTHCRNKSIDSSKCITSLETTASSSSGSSKCKRDSPTHSSPSKITKTKKTKESKKASASNHNNSTEERVEDPLSTNTSSSNYCNRLSSAGNNHST